jgi:hypothetical protein
MTAFVQICASHDDLFALDGRGDVYQYNFLTKTWCRLESRQPEDARRQGAEGESPLPR